VSIVVTATNAGSAHHVLAETVRWAKDGDPLRTVTVLVPTNAAGVMARRRLGHLGGIAAVEFITLYRLAERLGGAALRSQGRLPVSTAVVDLAVRAVLAEHTTTFDEVAEHASTITALRDLHRELRVAGSNSLTALASSSARGREAAHISSLVTDRLRAGWYDEGDLLARSIEAIHQGGLSADLAHVVAFLPQSFTPLDVEMLDALGRSGSVHVVLGVTGEPSTDADLLDALTGLDAPIPDLVRPAPRAAARVVSVTDADEEVRHAVRAIVDAARDGIPLGRIALLWPADQPYARLVEHHLGIAGIPWNGRPGTQVAERVVPRFLLDLLDVDRRGLRRRDLFELLADVPIRDSEGRRAPVASWERVSRDAGVVSDEHWTPRLRSYAAWQRRRADEHGFEPTRAIAADALADHVALLRHDLGPRYQTRSWSEWAEWAETQIAERIGAATLSRLDDAERQAHEHTTLVLDRLRHLDALGEPIRRSEFRAVFAAEFDVAPGRLGRIGTGVAVGSLSGAAGLTADLAIMLGAAEGLMPAAPPPDPLISESDRRAAGLASTDARAHRTRRQFLGVLDSVDHTIIFTPRGDLRSTADRQPSRWLAELTDATTVTIDSHVAGLATTIFPAHGAEHRLRGRGVAVASDGPSALADDHDLVLDRALRLRAARRSDSLTAYDGDLSSIVVPTLDTAVSPTQLESWASCPHAYFVQFLLGVRVIEEPGDDVSINALDRGNVVHDVLDTFHREVIEGILPQPTTQGWEAEHRHRLVELLDETSSRFEQAGRTGRAAYWAIDRLRLLSELLGWADHDSTVSIARRSTVVASEQRFGRDVPVTLELPSGRQLAVNGAIDRVDRTANGLVVSDHKSGSTRSFRDISHDDPTAHGMKFQLPAYAAAARQLLGADGPVTAEYSFLQKGNFQRIGYPFDADVWARVSADLDQVVTGIEGGWFPPTPEPPRYEPFVSCHYCQPDALGTAERFPEWERKQHDPRLHRWFGPDDEGHDESEGT